MNPFVLVQGSLGLTIRGSKSNSLTSLLCIVQDRMSFVSHESITLSNLPPSFLCRHRVLDVYTGVNLFP